jgi:hypothetical protein
MKTKVSGLGDYLFFFLFLEPAVSDFFFPISEKMNKYKISSRPTVLTTRRTINQRGFFFTAAAFHNARPFQTNDQTSIIAKSHSGREPYQLKKDSSVIVSLMKRGL